jgi:hypothetical protein
MKGVHRNLSVQQLFHFSYERFAHFERFRVLLENLGFKFQRSAYPTSTCAFHPCVDVSSTSLGKKVEKIRKLKGSIFLFALHGT